MIVATRIRSLTEQMRLATIRAAERRDGVGRMQSLIVELERRGYRVTRPQQAA
jgi:hypothetical protein